MFNHYFKKIKMQIENLEFFALNVLNLRHLYMNPSLKSQFENIAVVVGIQKSDGAEFEFCFSLF